VNDSSTPPIWALLIGIDCYMERTIAAIPRYPHLRGCVNDIGLMDDLLRTRLRVPAERILKLTASGRGSQPEEPREQWPTRANIVAAFQTLAQQAQPGDQVYIHYSGHGGRAVTLFPEVKGHDGLDESLVPTDYGQIENLDQPEDRYLRDLDLAALLQALVDRKLIVTIVIDSCHSGGASRGTEMEEMGMAVRGGDEIDRLPRTPDHLVASPQALMARWEQQDRGTRSVQLASGWLPDPQGYTLLAACRALELASEYTVMPGKRHGYLTYWLWQTLQKPMLNWEMVHQQVASRVYSLNRAQTPQLQGVGDRAVFGGASLALPTGVNVLRVEGEQVRLDMGQAGGVNVGAQFFIYPSGVTDFRQTDQRIAVVEVTESKDTEAWAQVLRRLRADAIVPGAQALLFDPGSSQRRAVRFVKEGNASAEIEENALAQLVAALAESESRFLQIATAGEAASFQVAVTAEDAYVIRDVAGNLLPNLPPAPISDPVEVVEQLIHLARFHNVLELTSTDAQSRLSGRLEVTLMESPEQPFRAPGGIPRVKSGEQIYYLRIRNLFEPMASPPSDAPAYIEEMRRRTLNITVLNLSPDWSISRMIPPPGEGADQIELGPGETLLLPRYDLPGQPLQLPAMLSAVPAGESEADDILKVFAATDTTSSYNSLLLPAIHEVGQRASLMGAPHPPEPERSWIAVQVQVRVVRK
jgi:hypothetical protein